MKERSVLIIVPTLGRRIDFLSQTLASIRSQTTQADIVVVVPVDRAEARSLAESFGASVIDDPGNLPGAINAGAAAARDHHEFINWLGDDDLLESGSLDATVKALDSDSGAVLAYGHCRYIDGANQVLWVSKAGAWAPRILAWGPDLIPQPGMLVRRSAWQAVGGLDESFDFAFDLDLLLKLRQQGTFIDVRTVVASFRWHADSLTVGDRSGSMRESETARRRYLSPVAARFAWTWEGPVRLATRMAAAQLGRRARRLSGAGAPTS